jgi:hypothetical protein
MPEEAIVTLAVKELPPAASRDGHVPLDARKQKGWIFNATLGMKLS